MTAPLTHDQRDQVATEQRGDVASEQRGDVASGQRDDVASGQRDDVATQDRSRADQLARRILRIENEVPGAVFPMRGSLMLSAVRCLITYVAIPLLVPIAGWLTPIAAPVSLVLTVVAGGMAITSLRRVWAANWSGRWGYTLFAVVVLLSLAGLLVVDLRAVLA